MVFRGCVVSVDGGSPGMVDGITGVRWCLWVEDRVKSRDWKLCSKVGACLPEKVTIKFLILLT